MNNHVHVIACGGQHGNARRYFRNWRGMVPQWTSDIAGAKLFKDRDTMMAELNEIEIAADCEAYWMLVELKPIG